MKTRQSGKSCILLAVLLTMVAAVLLNGCFGDKMEFELQGLSESTMRQIKHDLLYFEHGENIPPDVTVDNIRIDYYFGTYNNHIVFARLGYIDAISSIIIAGYEFTFPTSGTFMFAWRNGQIFDIQEAFQKGLLSRNNIRTMHKLHSRGQTN